MMWCGLFTVYSFTDLFVVNTNISKPNRDFYLEQDQLNKHLNSLNKYTASIPMLLFGKKWPGKDK